MVLRGSPKPKPKPNLLCVQVRITDFLFELISPAMSSTDTDTDRYAARPQDRQIGADWEHRITFMERTFLFSRSLARGVNGPSLSLDLPNASYCCGA
jgi:hypothetical protein